MPIIDFTYFGIAFQQFFVPRKLMQKAGQARLRRRVLAAVGAGRIHNCGTFIANTQDWSQGSARVLYYIQL